MIPPKKSPKTATLSSWIKPPINTYKVNLATIRLTSNITRSAAIIRNHEGSYIGHATHLASQNQTTNASYDALDYFIPLLNNIVPTNVIFEVDDRNVYEGIAGV
ncbi:unnamed protein product, partial [Cuscuta epithymum]